MNTTPYTVRQARPEEVSQVLDTLTEAFLNDPYMYKVLGEKPQEDKLRARFEVQLEGTYLPRGCVDVAVDLDGKILGTALWLSPENQQTDVKQELRDNAKFMRILGPRTMRHVMAENRELHKYRPKFKHWYLHTIAVRKAAQGLGVGTELLRHAIDRFDGTAAYLEASTPRSAALYERLGFIPMGTFASGDPYMGMLYPMNLETAQDDEHSVSVREEDSHHDEGHFMMRELVGSSS